MKFIIIGQLVHPVNGCTIANDTLIKHLDAKAIPYDFINTSTKNLDNKQLGKFSIKKVTEFAEVYLDIFKIFKSKIIYTTPGQTFFGIIKYSPFYLLCMLLGKPYVIHVHGNYLGKEYNKLKGIKKKIFGYFLSKSTIGIVLSNSLEKNFEGLLPKDRIRIVGNFANNELINKNLIKETKTLRVVYLSNLMKEKGILDLLDACILLKKKGVSFELKVAGKIEDGIENEVKERFGFLGSSCKYLGTVIGENKINLLNQANVFCLPTYYNQEGQPISILEGMATKNIILTTQHAGIPDIVNSSNGFFVKPQNPRDICEKLEFIEKNLTSLIETIGENNMITVQKNFTEKIFADNIISIFDEISAA